MWSIRVTKIKLFLFGLLLALGSTSTTFAKDKAPTYMTVQFSISDYSAWRPVFDAAEPSRLCELQGNERKIIFSSLVWQKRDDLGINPYAAQGSAAHELLAVFSGFETTYAVVLDT